MFREAKATVQSLRCIDSSQMAKQGIFLEGNQGSYYWSDAETKEINASINYRYQHQVLTLSYSSGEQSFNYSIRVDQTACNYGGVRSWFICPSPQCMKRVAKLYIGTSKVFICRHCNDLNYAIQQMSEKDKPRYHMNKMRDKLGWRYDHVTFLKRITKPSNMHHKTFKAMVAKHDQYEKEYLTNFQAFLDKFDSEQD